MSIQTEETALKPATPNTALQPSTRFRKVVFGGSLVVVAAFIAAGVGRLQAALANAWSCPFMIPAVVSLPQVRTLDSLLPGAPDGSSVIWWDYAAGDWGAPYTYSARLHKWAPSGAPPLPPVGGGCFMFCTAFYSIPPVLGPDPTPPTLILDSNKYYFLGSINVGEATYEDVVGAPPNNETTLLRYVGDGTAIEPRCPPLWDIYEYTDGVWSPSMPLLRSSEAVFIIWPSLRIKTAVIGAPPVMVLTWPRGTLESASEVGGPWGEVTNAQSGYVVAPTADAISSKYFRLRE